MKGKVGFLCAGCGRPCFNPFLAPLCQRCRREEEANRKALLRGVLTGALLLIVACLVLYLLWGNEAS